MNIQRASHLGFCFGVRDALALTHREAARQPTTVLGDLVHNDAVLAELRRRGVRLARELDAVDTHTVIITAHGTSDRTRRQVVAEGHRLVEATCPLVRQAHERVLELARAGYHVVIVGQRDHVEVRGLTGDLDSFDVILDERDVAALPPHARFGLAAQTTQPIARVRRLHDALKARFPAAEIRWIDTVCLPTKQRQFAAENLAERSDVVVVVGGAHSNNTRELVATCRRFTPRVHHVQTAADLDPAWFQTDDRVGLTAGTSTPDALIDSVEARLHAIAQEHTTAHPDVTVAVHSAHPVEVA